jgi:hypothetical protein
VASFSSFALYASLRLSIASAADSSESDFTWAGIAMISDARLLSSWKPFKLRGFSSTFLLFDPSYLMGSPVSSASLRLRDCMMYI